jgi:hypothetical protein
VGEPVRAHHRCRLRCAPRAAALTYASPSLAVLEAPHPDLALGIDARFGTRPVTQAHRPVAMIGGKLSLARSRDAGAGRCVQQAVGSHEPRASRQVATKPDTPGALSDRSSSVVTVTPRAATGQASRLLASTTKSAAAAIRSAISSSRLTRRL